MPQSSERIFVDLLFRASRKYANWDPEVPVRVGDYGRITQGRPPWAFWRTGRGIFVKEGNIYTEGLAKGCDIPEPEEYGGEATTEGATWITSKNARQVEFAVDVAGQTPGFAQCRVKAAFKFNSGRGAVLAMDNDTISALSSPGKLRRLLDENHLPKGSVIVSEVHRSASYARYLSSKESNSVAIGLAAEPVAPSVGSANVNAKWMHSAYAGNFKSKTNKSGKREFYPLFRLVSLVEQDVSTGFRGAVEEEPPLPDAEPPWAVRGEEEPEDEDDESMWESTREVEVPKKFFWKSAKKETLYQRLAGSD